MRELRTEHEIIQNWIGDTTKPLVSICCSTYNHEPFIEDALEGFLIQETDFSLEILIHDDASTDQTAEIIREYEDHYPNIIKPIYQTENQYSKNIRIMAKVALLSKGEYIAFCEGDDFWLSPNKLSTQVIAMRENPICELSFHPSFTLKYKENCVIEKVDNYGWNGELTKVIPVKDVLLQGGDAIPMASIVIQKNVMKYIEKKSRYFMTKNLGHFFYQFFGGRKAGCLYLPMYMSFYRSNHEGSWSLKVRRDPKFKIDTTIKLISSCEMADSMTNRDFHVYFKKIIHCKVNSMIMDINVPFYLVSSFISNQTNNLDFKAKIFCFIFGQTEFTHNFYKGVGWLIKSILRYK